MEKWATSLLPILLLLVMLSVFGLYQHSPRMVEEKISGGQWLLIEYREGPEKKGSKDTFLTDLLKQLKEVIDSWFKSINDEIEKEDITHFKVRFLEILRGILEWVKEKIDSWLEAQEKE